MNYKSRRVFACIIDLMLVVILAGMIASVPLCNPYLEKYTEYSEKYNKEMNNILNDISSGYDVNITFSSNIKNLISKVDHYSFFLFLWYIIFFYLYFVIFQFFTGGQTLGKKLFGLKVVSNDNNDATLSQLIKRSILLGNSLVNGVIIFLIIKMIIILSGVCGESYFFLSTGLNLASLIFEIVFVIYYLLNKEGKGLNDLLGGTKVIDLRV